MTTKNEALKQARIALQCAALTCNDHAAFEKIGRAIAACREALAQKDEQEPDLAKEKFSLPPVKFEQVAPGIEIGYDFFGGVDIRIGGEFVYVHINYAYPYTDNYSRKRLAEQIVDLLVGKPKRKPMTEGEIKSLAYDCNALPEVITDKTLLAFTRAIERAHGIGGEA